MLTAYQLYPVYREQLDLNLYLDDLDNLRAFMTLCDSARYRLFITTEPAAEAAHLPPTCTSSASRTSARYPQVYQRPPGDFEQSLYNAASLNIHCQ